MSLEVRCISTRPVPAASRYSYASGHPGETRQGSGGPRQPALELIGGGHDVLPVLD
jgi:hypothetical protein